MCKRLRIYLLPVLLLFGSFWLYLPPVCFAGASTSLDDGLPVPRRMALTVEEYSRLQTNLAELAQLNRTSQQELAKLRKQLAASQEALVRAQRQSMELTEQLAALKSSSAEQESLLATANESLEKYAQEQKRTRLRIKSQRNIAWGIAGCVLLAKLT